MAEFSSPIEQFAPEILERIAFHTGAGRNFVLGPPTHLVPLLCTSRTIYDQLSFRNNSHLYADLFRVKFDYGAPTRRLGDMWVTTSDLSSELRKRFSALKRIRRGDPRYLDDLWTAYLLMIESDGRNESQLIEWANVKQYLLAVLLHRAHAPLESPYSWFMESEGTSLVLWLMWMTGSQVGIRDENPHLRQTIVNQLLHPLVVAGYRYPSVFAPDSHFYLPLCEDLDVTAPHSSGPPSKRTTILHYAHSLTLAVPLLTPAALLGLIIRLEANQDISALPMPELPFNREAANALGRSGPTLEDFREFHYGTRTRFVDRCPIDVDSDCDSGSQRHDEDWNRLVACHDPWSGATSLRGMVYTLGALNGCWSGHLLMPNVDAYWRLIFDPHASTGSVPLASGPLFCCFQEHHCLHPDIPLASGTDASGLGDDVLNAWLPRGFTVKNLDEAIEVFDPTSGRHIRYETYLPDRPAPYSKAGCEKLRTSTVTVGDHEEIAEDNPNSGSVIEDDSQIDNDDEWSDIMEHQCSGVADILVTGETSERHGDAWGHFTYIGRVRPWDGFVLLLRIPKFDVHNRFGRWIFKGYIHHQNFVGRWREISTAVDMTGYEGGFVMCKTSGVLLFISSNQLSDLVSNHAVIESSPGFFLEAHLRTDRHRCLCNELFI